MNGIGLGLWGSMQNRRYPFGAILYDGEPLLYDGQFIVYRGEPQSPPASTAPEEPE